MGQINIRRIVIRVLFCVCILIALAQIGLSYGDVGRTDASGVNLSAIDLTGVPQAVIDDAAKIARELFGANRGKTVDFSDQLIRSYIEAKDKDLILLFNPGGWGITPISDAPGWLSIINGIKGELITAGYHPVVLEYRRTTSTVLGRWKEFIELLNHYPTKSRGLAERVKFLTSHIPNARVIVTGESNGTVVSDYAMALMRDNSRVYSIQTGTPFWHQQVVKERTLSLNSNGVRPDALSRGEVPTLIWSTVKQWLHLSAPSDTAHLGKYLNAPGHDYSWQYPEVYTAITNFLNTNIINGK